MKKEKKKGSCLKPILIAFGILLILGSVAGGGDKDSGGSTSETAEAEENKTEASSETAEKAASDEALSDPAPDVLETEAEEDDEPLGFSVMFSDTYRNDTTGNWRLARIAENINIEEYALDYYSNYFKADSEIHIIINFTLQTTTRVTVMGNLLDVAIMEYVDKEEHDAKLACSGMLLNEYHVNIDTGEIEKIQ